VIVVLLGEQHVEQGRGVGDGGGSTRRQAGDRPQLGLGQLRDRACQPRDRLRAHLITVCDRQRVAGLAHVEPRETAPGPADKVERQARALPHPACFVDQPGDVAIERLARLGTHAGDSQHAQGKRNALPRLAVADADEFETAAAEIADDAVRVGDGRQHALARADRFLLAGQEFDLKPHRPCGVDQLSAVGGVAHRRRRDGA
jgi:hypothetical protein